MRRVINANVRVGTSEAARRVGDFASRREAPEGLRIEAISVLGVWPAPSPLDRVDGAQLSALPARDADGLEEIRVVRDDEGNFAVLVERVDEHVAGEVHV